MSSRTQGVIGRILVSAGAIEEAELAAALQEQRETRERLGEILIKRGTDPERIARALAQQLRMPYAEPPLRAEPDALRLISRALAVRLHAVPLQLEDKQVRVALADPLDLRAVDDLEFQSGKRVTPVVASKTAVRAALGAYDADAVVQLVNRLPGTTGSLEQEPDVAALQKASEAPPIVSLVDHLLCQATALRASDIHVEPTAGALVVRVRVDGWLSELTRLPANARAAVVSRLKILAGLDISIKRKPQDGRATVRVGEHTYALRVSTLPAQQGEKVVLRILDPEQAAIPIAQLGMSPPDEERFARMLQAPHGLILVTGPTGSGKSTTLYAALSSIDRASRNVVTLEDPVEYRLPGATQVQISRRGGFGFANGLRAVLRQDPDVIMVGELRDRETVHVALAAAATGHLVLSTLHTNDAVGAITRLINLRAPPYLVASTLVGVLAQRLVRRLCLECTASGAHCGHCRGGYRGRTGVFEVVAMDERLRSLITRRAPEDELRKQARASGMRELAEDARRLESAGVTTLEEIRSLTLALE
jgi:type IV pilus assembly protein PilB